MQWNDFDYETQLLVIDRLASLMLKEKDDHVQFAMAAAIVELEMWSNSPCLEFEPLPEGPYVAQATDPIPEDEYDSFD
jgi:hypothetical protein